MEKSLLALLYPRIKGSQEDIATLSLNHILGQSNGLRKEFTRLISERLQLDNIPVVYYPQVSGKDKERPDIVGVVEGKERIIIEAKFFASLTENQPVTYLERLKGQGGLIFICPQSRQSGLWNQLLGLVSSTPIGDGNCCVNVDGTHMAVISWKVVFDDLLTYADNYEPETLENLHQLIDFKNVMENSSFIPFKQEDFGADFARSIERFYDVVDNTLIHLLHRKDVSATKGTMHRAAQRFGYTQYVTINDITLGIYYHLEIWKKSSPPSPFAIGLFYCDPTIANSYYATLESWKKEKDNSGMLYIVLDPPVGLNDVESAKYLADQIVEHVNGINSIRQKQKT